MLISAHPSHGILSAIRMHDPIDMNLLVYERLDHVARSYCLIEALLRLA
jgi:hypothetical protein